MSKILIAYSTVDGQTKKIAETLSENIKGEVVVKRFEEIKDITEFDKIIIGSSIRYGKFPKKLYRFVEKNQKELEERQADFFGVNLIARNPEKCVVENNVYVRKFLDKISWKPNKVQIYAGALNYTTYKLFDKKMIQLIMKMTDGPTNPSVDLEFTDWEKVCEYAEVVNHR
ncbi:MULTISPECIES: menaquinone-dependent protoporphyrinogen IX dehydrogenase [Vagococcus]|uniref:Protoporphyrinogen IX dehydrogenase [quinone] n=1 Tax=Vagococcus fluvialis bH819 TaxID=1255619 RepID=A0A1X6WLH1_9ENTE|nr:MULTISPECIES: menaquinone-dependent protoporphyrinogen IX dehydrogenase [Vagococcus]SLM85117.1 Protoporphyrinogen IX oxidase, oxygen-independent, HemG [Vagococcus fluvialis bH819]HCM88466.1 menaquinone-dependent protoporphyrinogen IX dehydrogenase [Vagococcus sp.]